jgi:hypothetical protein
LARAWTAIALHTTPGIPEHMRPTIVLVTAGVEMDVLGIAYDDFSKEYRDHVCAHHPREANFKEYYRSLRRRHHQEALDDLWQRQGGCSGAKKIRTISA